MNTVELDAESLEFRYRRLRPKLDLLWQELLDRLFREYKHYSDQDWFSRHLRFLESEFSPRAEEARQLKMKALRAAELKRLRSRSNRHATATTAAESGGGRVSAYIARSNRTCNFGRCGTSL